MGLETIAAVAAIGSSVVGAAGQIAQGNAQSAAAGYNSKVAANNAQIETQNAAFQGAVGEVNAGQSEMRTRAQFGATRANQGASGVTTGKGSFNDVLTSERELGQLNAMQIRSDAARKAYGFQTEAASYQGQSALDRMQASYDKKAGYINAATTVLGGASRAAMFAANPTAPPDTFNDYLNSSSNVPITDVQQNYAANAQSGLY